MLQASAVAITCSGRILSLQSALKGLALKGSGLSRARTSRLTHGKILDMGSKCQLALWHLDL